VVEREVARKGRLVVTWAFLVLAQGFVKGACNSFKTHRYISLTRAASNTEGIST
jgi:hypothetical protein